MIDWLLVLVVGTGLLMRHLSLRKRLPELPQTVLIVALATGLLVLAGVGGFALMQGATPGG